LAETSHVTVCTLWEGDYHKGAVALTNSLYAKGYRGTVWMGYRGPLPAWANGATGDDMQRHLPLADGLDVVLVKLETQRHFAHYKPQFLRRVLEELDPQAEGVYYFDPIVLALAEWEFFERWVGYGIALCEDSHYPLNASHPHAQAWKQFAVEAGMEIRQPVQAYFNSGLVGVRREHAAYLDAWETLMERLLTVTGTGDVLRFGTRASVFHNLDQDTCTLATWTTDIPVSWVGVDGMAFERGAWLVAHAVFSIKPWRRKPLKDLLKRGIGPDALVKLYWQHVERPIALESPKTVRGTKRSLALASLLGRVYRRPPSSF